MAEGIYLLTTVFTLIVIIVLIRPVRINPYWTVVFIQVVYGQHPVQCALILVISSSNFGGPGWNRTNGVSGVPVLQTGVIAN